MYSRFTSRGRAARRFTFKMCGIGLGVLTLSGLVYALNQSSGTRPAPYSPPVTPVPFEIQSTLAPARPDVRTAPRTLFSPEVQRVEAPEPQPELVPTVASNPLPDPYPYPYQERSREYRPPRPRYPYPRPRETSGLETHNRETHTLPTRTIPSSEREAPPPRRTKEPKPPHKAKDAIEDKPKPDRHRPPLEKGHEKARDKKHDSPR